MLTSNYLKVSSCPQFHILSFYRIFLSKHLLQSNIDEKFIVKISHKNVGTQINTNDVSVGSRRTEYYAIPGAKNSAGTTTTIMTRTSLLSLSFDLHTIVEGVILPRKYKSQKFITSIFNFLSLFCVVLEEGEIMDRHCCSFLLTSYTSRFSICPFHWHIQKLPFL